MNAKIARACRVVAFVLDRAAWAADTAATVARCYAEAFDQAHRRVQALNAWKAAQADIPRHDGAFNAGYGEAV
ncbi:hypothetical protein ABZ215_24835 [Amycolatopsis sp. NPDC006131]|uniref:hypothetical protein n=1 Tax=Amycolatopsis sp. NPDC006131 TaxID=3156731 RepID=UPI0033B38911